MEYITPVVEVAGPASELIKARFGPTYDGNGYVYSQGFVCDPQE